MKNKQIKAAAAVMSFLALSALAACDGDTTHSHDYGEWIDEIPATCTVDGTLGHYHCEGCGKDFDADYIEMNDLTIDAGHRFSTTLTYDDGTGHYYPAICEHTDEKSGFAPHELVPSADGTEKTCVCGYSELVITELDAPTNLAYNDFVLSFDAVTGAAEYKVDFVSNSVTVATHTTAATTLDLKENHVPFGTYTIKVTARRGTLSSASAELASTRVDAYDGDVVIEAETAALSPKHFTSDEAAHGGGYADGIRDCGQGLYFRYFAYEAGERDLEVAYATAQPDSYMGVYVGGVRQRSVKFKENTGLFGENKTTAKSSVKITVEAGWNEIYIIKDGSGNDEPAWGGNAQLDYVTVKGTGESYTTDFDMSAETYKLEAEAADWHWTNEDQRPAYWAAEGFSLGYGLGEMNAEGDGVTFRFKVTESGAYHLNLAYGGGAGATKVAYSVNGGDAQQTTLVGANGWNDVTLSENAIGVMLTAGEWITVDFSRLSNDDGGSWFTIDYLLVTKVDHLHEFTEERATSEYLASEATCTEAAKYYYSCAHCGEAGTATFAHGDPNGHTWATTLTSDDPAGHYYAATCEHTNEKKDFEEHHLVEDAANNVRTCACGYSVPMIDELDAPANLAFSNVNVLTFDEVTNAKQYVIDIYSGSEKVETLTVTTNSCDLTGKVPAGRYTVKVKAKCVDVLSEEASLDVNVLVIDGDVILEAEDAVLNGTGNVRENAALHGGKYVGGIDDCGQGLYFRYFAYEAGERTIEVYYATGNAGSFMGVYVNGTKQGNATFATATGWLGNDQTTTAKADVSVTFVQGWNEIYLVKDGTDSDTPAYGGNGEIDYIKVKGTGKGFDVATVDKSASSYKLEAECAAWHWADANNRPSNWKNDGGFSQDFGLGNISAEGDGVKFRFRVSETGTYTLRLAYSGSGSVNVKVSVNGGDAVDHTLTGASGSWNNVALDTAGYSVQLTAGEWYEIDFSAASAADCANWWCTDYLLVTKAE